MHRRLSRSLPGRGVAAALAATIALAPACHPAVGIATPRLTPSSDDLGGAGAAVVTALRARRDAGPRPPIELMAMTAASNAAVDADPAEPAPPIEEPLTLTALTADIVVEGPLAYTQLALAFTNPEARTREGRFSITLPTDAAIGRFAMHTADGWREAEVVSRVRARQVYEEYLHRGVDPALLEQASANTFAARVFPIAPKQDTELVIGYSQEATRSDPVRLALHGLPRVHDLTIRIHRGADVETRAVHDAVPEDVTVELDAGAPAVAAGTAFVARVPVPASGHAVPLTSAYVLIDTSASRAGMVGAQLAAVGELVRGMPDDGDITIAAFDQRVGEVYRGRAGAFDARVLDAVVARGALGASDLATALAAAAASGRDRVILIGDAVATAGETRAGALAARLRDGGVVRVDVLQLGESLDAVVAAALAAAGRERGAVLRVADGSLRGLVPRLTAATADRAEIEVEGATWSWPTSTAGATGDELVVYGRRAAGAADRPLRVTIGGRARELVPAAAADALVDRAVARAELGVLAMRAAATTDPAKRAALAGETRTLALRHRLVSSETSFLVLESDADYARFCLTQDRLPDLLVVDGARGLQRRARRPPSVAAEDACKATAASPAAAPDPEPAFPTAAEALATARRAAAEEQQRLAAEEQQRLAAEAEARREAARHAATAGAAHGTSVGGVIKDQASGEPLVGVTLVATAAGGGTAITAITDEHGAYVLEGLAPGSVTVTAYYVDRTVARSVRVRRAKRTPLSFSIDTSGMSGETIRVEDRAPMIDATSTSQGITLDQEYTRNIPVPGRTFEGALGAAAGSAGDGAGVSFSGATSLENSYQAGAEPGDASTTGAATPAAPGDPTGPGDAARAVASPPPPAGAPDAGRARRIVMPPPARDGFGRPTTVPDQRRAPGRESGVLADVHAAIDRGDRTGALSLAARRQVEAPADIATLLALGEAAESAGAIALAARAYGSLVDLFPGQAELVRAAAVRLERLGPAGLDLALDAYARAAADRPDHLHGVRLLAWARARTGDLDGAYAVIDHALATHARHAAEAANALAADLAVLAALIAAADPARRPAVEARLVELGIPWASVSSTRAFLTWETDANDVDLHVMSPAGGHAWYGSRKLEGGGELLADITRGYGPEVFVQGADAGPLRVAAHYYSRGPMGIGLGALQVIRYDAAAGTATVELRPFALDRDDAVVDLGTLPGAPAGR